MLRGAALGTGVLAVSALTGCSLFASRDPISTVGAVDFGTPLRIPPLAESTKDGATRVFDLTLAAGRTAIVPQGETDTWGVNGSILGPTLRATRGEPVRIIVRNELDEATSLHWHGMRLPAYADGGPHQMIAAGATWAPEWTIDQHAATLWYHPHPHGTTELHVLRGLGGFFYLDDPDEQQLALPREYGVDDIPLIVQDRTFDDSGAFVETQRIDNGMLGTDVMVNGTVGGVLDVTAELTRLRILNASAARSYTFGFADDRAFTMIASDGGLLGAPHETDRLLLTPGERAEIVVRCAPGEEVILRSYAQDLGVTQRIADRTGASDELDVLLVRAAETLRASPALPTRLGNTTGLVASDAVATRAFDLGDNRINGQAMDMARIDVTVAAETVEVWKVTNAHTRPHNFHIHDVQFLITDIDGEKPTPELAGWKDTVYVAPGSTATLVMRFGKHFDPPADALASSGHAGHGSVDGQIPYMFHCHLLWHEDQGMMGQFVVE